MVRGQCAGPSINPTLPRRACLPGLPDPHRPAPASAPLPLRPCWQGQLGKLPPITDRGQTDRITTPTRAGLRSVARVATLARSS